MNEGRRSVPPRWMRRGRFAVAGVLAGVLGVVAPSTLWAQGIENHRGPVVTGEVVDQQTRRPVPGAAVRLVSAKEARVLGAAWTDRQGRYVIPLFLDDGEDPGDLVVEAETLGYLPTTTPSFRLRPGRITPVGRISLRPEPVVLDTIGVTAERRRWTELAPPRERVRRRQLEGRGIFLPGALVEGAQPPSLPEFVADRVDGVEVYPRWSDVPDDLQMRITQVASMRSEFRCTVVNVWLWNAWNRGVDLDPGT